MARKSWQPGAHAQRHRGKRPAARPRARDATGLAILYGWHTVKAALENPARRFRRLLATENALRRLTDDGVALPLKPELVRPDVIDAQLGPDAVHQGLLAEVDSLAGACADRDRAGRHRSCPRPDHRPAQCRGDLTLGRRLRGEGDHHHRAAQPGGNRRAGKIGVRRARACSPGHRAESRARA